MKKLLGIIIFLLGVVTSVYAEDTVTIPLDDYKAILHRLDALQERVEFLESSQTGPKGQSTSGKKLVSDTDLEYIYDSIDDLETKQLQNKMNFGAELRTRVDAYRVKNLTAINTTLMQQEILSGVPPAKAILNASEYIDTRNDYNNWTNRFRINMNAQITDGLAFHGRLAMYKNWGDSDDGTDTGFFNDSNRAQMPNSSALWVDRAYVDWIPQGSPVPLAITIGRHPSSEGPPFELKENRLRQSTYPALIFDGEADGIVATVGLERYTDLKESGLRFAYGKMYHSDDEFRSSTPFPFFDDNEAGDSTIFASLLETRIPGLEDSLLVFSYAKIWDLPFCYTGPQLPNTGIANSSLGDLDLWGVHAQAKNIRDSGLDFFFSYGGNSSDPNENAPLGFYGLLSQDGHENHKGYALYSGLRYTLPFEGFRQAKFGLEYNYGSRYWFSMTMGPPDLFNKLATRGSVYDFYYIQPVNKYLFFRTGYLRVNYNYTGSGSYQGQPLDTNATLDNIYLLMDVHF